MPRVCSAFRPANDPAMGISGRAAVPLLALLTVRSPLAGAQELSVIELRHRSAEELVPVIQPLLGPGDAIVPNRNQLILRADPATVREIRALLDQIDRSPHRLLISVAQGSETSGESAGTGAEIRGRIDPNQPNRSGAAIRGGAYQSQGRDQTHATQQVQTLDGQPAMIQMGSEVPVPSYGYGIQYQPVTTGFAVTPRLSGNRVTIAIEPWSDRLSYGRGGVIETRSARTQVTAGLGEWVEIGGAMETSVWEQSGLAGGSYASGRRDSRILLKVEDLDAGQP
jgi:type II secretory pathway component GspD/PulD (secretin)